MSHICKVELSHFPILDWSATVGWVVMSERELKRIEVLSQVTQGRMTTVTAANVLGISRRQVQRLLKTFQTGGAAAIRHKARGRRSNNHLDPGVRDFAITTVKEQYSDFGPTFAAELLAEHHDLEISRETLRKWMSEAGIWLSRKQRRTFHQPRLRRECVGELIQPLGTLLRNALPVNGMGYKPKGKKPSPPPHIEVTVRKI